MIGVSSRILLYMRAWQRFGVCNEKRGFSRASRARLVLVRRDLTGVGSLLNSRHFLFSVTLYPWSNLPGEIAKLEAEVNNGSVP